MNKPAAITPDVGAREKLIETASAVMRGNDSIDLSFSELSMRSGLNSALVKYYFGNKTGLMLALLERDMASIVDALHALIAKDLAPDEKLRRHIGGVVDTYYRYPYLNRLMMRMVRDSEPEVASRLAKEYLQPISQAYEALLNEGIEQGLFRDIDSQSFYFAVTGAADRFFSARFVLYYCYDGEEMTDAMRDKYRTELIELIMAGILKH